MRNPNALKKSPGDKLFTGISLVILSIIMISIFYPMWVVLIASLSNPTRIYETKFLIWIRDLTVDSYKLVFENQNFIIGFINSVLYTIVGTIVNVIMNICAAYPLSKNNFKGKSFFTLMFTFTMFFSGGLIPSYLLMNQLKLLNNFWVMIIPSAVNMFNVIVMRTYFQSRIPQELEEAAKVDGCTNFRLLIKIVLPLSVPILAVISLYYGVGHWNDFFTALVYITDKKLFPLQMVLRSILLQNQLMGAFDQIAADEGYALRMMARMGLKYAVIVVSTVPIFIVYPLVQKFFAKGVMVGAIKG